MNVFPTKITQFLCFALFLSVSFSCYKTIDAVPRPSDFTKANKEKIGDLVHVAILANTTEWPVLTNTPPYDTSTYWYIQKMYDQITNSMHLDVRSPEDNSWDEDRQWRVTILKNDTTKTAFTTPGGNFYISTGLLKDLQEEYELAYIMAFESVLMNENYLFNTLVNEFNTQTLKTAIAQTPSAKNTLLDEIALFISDTNYDSLAVARVDELTAEVLCTTSIFDRLGLLPLLERWDVSVKWIYTRSYAGRTDYIQNYEFEYSDDCGNFRTDGGYQRYVLDHLE